MLLDNTPSEGKYFANGTFTISSINCGW